MKESYRRHEIATHFPALNGTILKNFTKGAFINNEGMVVYDKRNVPGSRFAEMYFAKTFKKAFLYAGVLAEKQEDVPIVMYGELNNIYKTSEFLPIDVLFPVQRIWKPKSSADINKILHEISYTNGPVLRYFEEIDPYELLTQYVT